MLIRLLKNTTVGAAGQIARVSPIRGGLMIRSKLASEYDPRVELKVVTPETKNMTSPKKRNKKKVHE